MEHRRPNDTFQNFMMPGAHAYARGSLPLHDRGSPSTRAYGQEYNCDYDCNHGYDYESPNSSHSYTPYGMSGHPLSPHGYNSSYGYHPSPFHPTSHLQSHFPIYSPIESSDLHCPAHLMYPIWPLLPLSLPTRSPLPSSRRSSRPSHIHHSILPSPRRQATRWSHMYGIKGPDTYTFHHDDGYAPDEYNSIIREGGRAGRKAFMEAHGPKISRMENRTEAERLLEYEGLVSRMRRGNGKGMREHDAAPTQSRQDQVEQGENGTKDYNLQKRRSKRNHQQAATSDPNPDLDCGDELDYGPASCVSRTPMKGTAYKDAVGEGALTEALFALELAGQESGLPSRPPCAPSPPPACASADFCRTKGPLSTSYKSKEISTSETKNQQQGDNESIPKRAQATKRVSSDPKVRPGYRIRSSHLPNNILHSVPNKHIQKTLQKAPPASLSPRLPLKSDPPPTYEENDENYSSDEYIGPETRVATRHDCINPLHHSLPSASSPFVSLIRVTYAMSSDSEEEEQDDDYSWGTKGGESVERMVGTGEYINESIREGREDEDGGSGDRRTNAQDWTRYRIRLW